ncbi:MAG: peptide chain release factor N(5)-glutamine methyltransferase [Patescibacteria group bacterium]
MTNNHKKQTIRDTLYHAAELLKQRKITSAHLDAEVILSFVFKKPKEYLYTYPEKLLSKPQSIIYKKLVNKRAKRFPVAYLIGRKEFFGLDFFVNKHVLIPRPETEFLVEQALTAAALFKNNLTIADIGTGSGCIAVALAKNLPGTKVFATDISKEALVVARKNSKHCGVNVNFMHGSLSTPLKNKKIDIIMANLPYLPHSYKHESIKHEPRLALYAGKFGLESYERLFQQVARFKYQPKLILLEAGTIQMKLLQKIIKKNLFNAKTKTIKNPDNKQKIISIET